MRPSKFNDDQVKQAIAQVKGGTPLVVMCRKMGVTQTTFYRWRKRHGDDGTTVPHEARVLREENHKLKQLVADLYVEQQFLRESITKHARAVREARG